MKKNVIAVCIMAASAMLASCDKKQQVKDNLDDFVTELSERADDMTPEEWDEATAKYERIVAEMESIDFTDEELREIGRIKGVAAKKFAKRKMKEAGAAIDNVMKQAAGFLEGLTGKDEE